MCPISTATLYILTDATLNYTPKKCVFSLAGCHVNKLNHVYQLNELVYNSNIDVCYVQKLCGGQELLK